jgi:hypothetical protein
MRLGFCVGFLMGALIASIKPGPEVAEAPEPAPVVIDEVQPRGLVDKIKTQARQAVAAARQEADRKEAELLREFEATKQTRKP